MPSIFRTLLLIIAGWGCAPVQCNATEPAVLGSEFIFDSAPFRSCHASTIAQTPDGFVAAWFGGSDEGNADVSIWTARRHGDRWSAPEEVANGADAEGKRNPCWNPVLFQPPGGALTLFYKVGPNPRQWWGMRMTSDNGGRTWSKPSRLPDGFLGPIKNKPIELDGVLLCPSSTEHDGWRVHIERTADLGQNWTKTEPLNDGRQLSAIQPTILTHAGGKLQFLCRTRQQKIFQSWSNDAGKTWSELKPTMLPNPNSGIDAVNLADGRCLVVYNHTASDRSPLNVAVSADGEKWQAALALETEPGEYSYPAVIRTADGKIHATYTWNRKKIKHVVLDPKDFVLKDMPEGKWPK